MTSILWSRIYARGYRHHITVKTEYACATDRESVMHHRRRISFRWSPCWSSTAAAGTIGKSISFVYTTGVSGDMSILPSSNKENSGN
jgi:hypothetical protein